LEGEITPSLTAVCARCGNEFNYSVPTKLYAKVAASLENGDNDDFVIMPMIGFVLGVTAAKLTVDGCTCGKGIVKKAKKAFRTMEQSLPF
ncbi:MAG: hypothetical protein J5793_01130, partial [Clostridia bacterium]|nr:hypothetical protein [Clostridia bacterium]